MKNVKSKSMRYAIRFTIILAIVGFILSIMPTLIDSGWNFSKLTLKWYNLFIPLNLLGISIAFIFISTINQESIDKIDEKLAALPNQIEVVTKNAVNFLKFDIDDFKRKLSNGIVTHEEFTYRALKYFENQGVILNGFSGDVKSSRNILFSNKTINLIFREIKKVNIDALRAIGRKSSDRFAQELVSVIRKNKKAKDLYDWINQWIEFDSDAGFGKFALGHKSRNEWKSHMTIVLKYSFLASESETHYHEKNIIESELICDFMTGYIEGIINHFPPQILKPYGLTTNNIIITHDTKNPEECICAGREPEDGCVFNIKSI
jgi:hypothetical protein